MKITVDRLSVVARPPVSLAMSDAGNPILSICESGTVVHVELTPIESRSLGVQLIENSAVGTLIKQQAATPSNVVPIGSAPRNG
jgi:hypothetical protein